MPASFRIPKRSSRSIKEGTSLETSQESIEQNDSVESLRDNDDCPSSLMKSSAKAELGSKLVKESKQCQTAAQKGRSKFEHSKHLNEGSDGVDQGHHQSPAVKVTNKRSKRKATGNTDAGRKDSNGEFAEVSSVLSPHSTCVEKKRKLHLANDDCVSKTSSDDPEKIEKLIPNSSLHRRTRSAKRADAPGSPTTRRKTLASKIDFDKTNMSSRSSNNGNQCTDTLPKVDNKCAKSTATKRGRSSRSVMTSDASSRGSARRDDAPSGTSDSLVTTDDVVPSSSKSSRRSKTRDVEHTSPLAVDWDLDSVQKPGRPNGKHQNTNANPIESSSNLGESSENVPSGINGASLGKVRAKGRPRKSLSAPDPEKAVTCVHCNESLPSYQHMRHHMMRSHTLLYSSEHPEGLSDYGALKMILQTLGKLYCPQCGKHFNGPQYYQLHRQWCGREDEKEVCDICNRLQKSMFLEPHRRNCVKKQAEKERVLLERLSNVADPDEVKLKREEAGPARRRSAASKALDLIKCINEGDHQSSEAPATGDNFWKSKYKSPPVTQPTPVIKLQWKVDLKEQQQAKCAHSRCGSVYSSYEAVFEHYLTCLHNGQAKHKYVCTKCKTGYPFESAVRKHVLEAHKLTQKKDEVEDDDYMAGRNEQGSSSSGGDSDVTCDESDLELDKVGHRSIRGGEKTFTYPVHNLPHISKDKLCNKCHGVEPPVLPWHMPCPSRLLQINGTALTKQTSCPFLYASVNAPVQLSSAHSVRHRDGFISYVGDTIKHVAWCPLDSSALGSHLSHSQFAAVCCSPGGQTASTHHPVGDCNPAQSHIQVWMFPDLRSEVGAEPRLALRMQHSFGEITDTRWCVHGGPKLEQKLGRLGLLALASKTGTVHIISVPWRKQDEQQEALSQNNPGIYRLDEELQLTVPGDIACLCVDWQRTTVDFICAGYEDGSLSLWYVGTQLSEQPAQKKLPAARVFRSFTSPVTAVSWCASSPNLFASFSIGCHVWDVNDTSVPYLIPKTDAQTSASLVTRAVWPRQHNAVITALDPSCGSPAVRIQSLGYVPVRANQKTLLPNLHFTSALDIGDCEGTLVAGDVMGKVFMSEIVPQYIKTPSKKCLRDRMALDTSVADDKTMAVRYSYNTTASFVSSETSRTMDCMQWQPAHAIYSVSLNPNKGTHKWLLCGGIDGLLHAILLDEKNR